MAVPSLASVPHPAVVSRPPARPQEPCRYLLITPDGAPAWTPDPEAATAFASMKEAARAAVRLPSAFRAYGLPLMSELATRGELH